VHVALEGEPGSIEGGRRALPLAALGQALAAAVSVGQSVLILTVAGAGVHTDAFLAAFLAYLPIGTLAATVRISGIVIVGGGASKHQISRRIVRVNTMAVTVGGLWILLSPALTLVLTRSLPSSVYAYSLLSLIILAAAGTLQLSAAGYGARLSALGRLTTSNLLYGVGGLGGLVVSALAMWWLGAIGAAIGLVTTAVLILVAHVARLPTAPPPWRLTNPFRRSQASLARSALAAAAIPVTVQAHLVFVLWFAPGEPGAISGITYSFLFYSLLLSCTFQVVGALGLSRMASERATPDIAAVDRLVIKGAPLALMCAAPVAVTAVVLGPAAVDSLPESLLPEPIVTQTLNYLAPMGLAAIPWGVQTLLFSCAVAVGRVRSALIASLPSFAVLLSGLVVVGTVSPWRLGAVLFAAEFTYAVMLAAVVLEDRLGRVARALGWRLGCLVALAIGLAALGYDQAGGPAFLAVLGASAMFATGLLLSRRFEALPGRSG
jgi:hypothetical protein